MILPVPGHRCGAAIEPIAAVIKRHRDRANPRIDRSKYLSNQQYITEK